MTCITHFKIGYRRRMRRSLMFVPAASLLIASPAVAAPIPVPQAEIELAAAVAATNAASTYRYASSYLGETAAWNAAGYYMYALDGRELRTYADGTFLQRINWPNPQTRAKVIGPRYLNDPSLEWMSISPASRYAEELTSWSDLVASPGSRRGHITYLIPLGATAADKTPTPAGTQYTLSNASYEMVFTVDSSGRIDRVNTTRFDGAVSTDRLETWEYSAVPIDRPASIPIETARRAIQAATLKSTIREIARDAASDARRARSSLRTVRYDVEEDVDILNAAGDGSQDEPNPRLVKIRQRPIPGGVRIFRKNPYTGTFHEWRVTLRGGVWRAYRTAP